MSASKLKNIALLILLLTNLVLLGQVILRESRTARYRDAALNDAIAILVEGGIDITRERVPDEPLPSPANVSRDQAAEASFAAILLGDETTAAAGSSAVSTGYESQSGTLRLYSDGALDAALTPDAHPLGQETPEQHAGALLRRLGIDGEVVAVRDEGADTVVTLRQWQAGSPVFPCLMEFHYAANSLAAISGRLLPGTPTAAAGAGLSPATLLLRFRTAIRERGDVCSEIRSIVPGYDLAAAFSGPSRLFPVLLIEIDGGRTYYLNIETGELRPA